MDKFQGGKGDAEYIRSGYIAGELLWKVFDLIDVGVYNGDCALLCDVNNY